MRARFVMSQVLKGLANNMAMTISVILVTFISLLFVGSGVLLQMQVGKLKSGWLDKVEVSISMCSQGDEQAPCEGKEATQQQLDELGAYLESGAMKPFVKKVYFQSKEEAFKEFQERFEDTPLANYATAEMLPASYKVKLVNPEQYKVIKEQVEGRPGVQSVIDQTGVLEPLFNLLNRMTALSLGLAGVMMLAAVLLITTTIRLSAMSREKETGIMRLVGASNFFIQLPFMIEGAIAATIGALLAVGGLAAGIKFMVQGWLQPSFQWMTFVKMSDLLILGPVLVLAAIVLAALASAITLARYTKV